MTTSHSPAPFTCNMDETVERLGCILDAKGQVVADNIYGRTDEQAQANARVLTASPLLLDACKDVIVYLNMEAQRRPLSLPSQLDDLRQKVCIAASIATGYVLCGNLQRIDETRQAMADAGVGVIP